MNVNKLYTFKKNALAYFLFFFKFETVKEILTRPNATADMIPDMIVRLTKASLATGRPNILKEGMSFFNLNFFQYNSND